MSIKVRPPSTFEPEGILMAATRIIEEERGTYVGFVMHAHNSYYAGDFSRRDSRSASAPSVHPFAPTPALPFLDHLPRHRPPTSR